MRAQLSVEMLVILVVILGMVVLLASVMLKSANKAAEKVEEKSGAAINATDASLKGLRNDYCVIDDDCRSLNCDTYARKCL
jgi:uncharacterized protein (UPF0333 family)